MRHTSGPSQAVLKQPNTGLMTVVDTVYYQQSGQEPTVASSRYNRRIVQDEQPFMRIAKVGTDWISVDTGWVEEAGMLMISNEEDLISGRNPTPEELTDLDGRVIEVAFGDPNDPPEHRWLILPGESMRAHPSDVKALIMRCQTGSARYKLSVFPR